MLFNPFCNKKFTFLWYNSKAYYKSELYFVKANVLGTTLKFW
ncbi:hypothetical protein HMPREF1397_01113 [Helicobacter pylori GAM115Ai]|nr:hypothetical protein HMPREF1397_01113 [Helicobacter pylori GAM115Ai]EMH23783.1 hypothetical protein HMPREF1419_01012 [Helicobacter pylori GAM263BFi]